MGHTCERGSSDWTAKHLRVYVFVSIMALLALCAGIVEQAHGIRAGQPSIAGGILILLFSSCVLVMTRVQPPRPVLRLARLCAYIGMFSGIVQALFAAAFG